MKKLKVLAIVLMLMVGVICFSACKPKGYEILTNSMAPVLEMGDRVVIEAKDEYNVGDIVRFSIDGVDMKIVHRIIFILEDNNVTYYICKADNTQNLDGTDSNGLWVDDYDYIKALVDGGATTMNDIIVATDSGNLSFVEFDQIQGAVYDIIRK